MENDYLTRQKPMKALLLFALPIILGNLFQQFYTMVDSAIVGRYVGEQALAAVGASYALTNIFICVAIGGGIGASVVVSQYFGAKEYGKMQLALFTSFLSFLIISTALGGVGLLAGRQIMTILHTPADVLDMATQYLNIYFIGLPFLFMYNIVSSMFNALGKSRIPLYFLIFSSILNVVLDLVFVRRYGWGVAGAAWATLIAQGLSAVLSFAVFLRLLKSLHCGRTGLFSGGEARRMAMIALPSILQQSTVSLGMMLVQAVVNGFGSEALAGYSAAMRIESICCVPMTCIGNAVSSYTAQNIGAGCGDRVPEGLRASRRMVYAFAAVICFALELFPRQIIALFIGADGTEAAFATGMGYLTFMGWFFTFMGLKMSVDGLLRGAGDMTVFTIANLVNLSVRVAVAAIGAPRWGIAMVWYAVPLGWMINGIISYAEYHTGKWKRALRTHTDENAPEPVSGRP